jgi:transposase-like protein
MKSGTQLIESIVSLRIRQKVSEAIQPGKIQNIVMDTINKLLADILNKELKLEAEQELARKPYERLDNPVHRNGYKESSILGFGTPIALKRPVVRKGSLKLPLFEALKQAGKGLMLTLATAFWLKGSSTRNTANILRETFGAKMTASDVSRITNALEPGLTEWENRAVPEDIEYLFLDALYLPVQWRKTLSLQEGFTTKQALLCCLGIDSQGQTHVLGHLLGLRENLESWEALIEALLKRGLNPSRLRLVISDEHKAIIGAVQNKLGTPHQYCIFHKMKNIRLRVPNQDRQAYLEDFRGIFWAKSREDAVRAVGVLEGKWASRYPKVVELTLANLDNFLMFMNEPKARWKALRTSNRIERFNAELRRRLRPAGTIHSGLELTKIFWSVSESQERTWKKKKAFRVMKEDAANQAA